jgi:GntR family transcriptional regulator
MLWRPFGGRPAEGLPVWLTQLYYHNHSASTNGTAGRTSTKLDQADSLASVAVTMDDPRPTYLQVADAIRDLIRSGQLKANDKLPSVRELAERYGIAPATVQSSLRELRDRGWVYAQSTRGHFVRGVPPEASSTEGHSSEYVSVMARLSSMSASLEEVKKRLATLERNAAEGASTNLKEEIAALRVQLMDLYSRVGQPYPHETEGDEDAEAGGEVRRLRRAAMPHGGTD